jgi:hypothetical protein
MKLATRQAWRKDSSKTLVIHHGGCPDGTCAAACALLAYPEAETMPAMYGDDPPDVAGKDVIIVDFSYPREVLKSMADSANSLQVLDHHKTAAADLLGFPGSVFDMGRSGAGLAWDVLVGGIRPEIVDYVEDRDLWLWRLESSRAIGAWILSLPVDQPEQWLPYVRGSHLPATALTRGEGILEFQYQWCAQVADTAERGTIAGHDVPVVNAPHPLGSNVLEEIYNNEPFAARWQRRPGGKYQYSLASAKDGLDVSEIAREFGGGGHKHAAGFTADRLVHL